ncbi:MULTISPECIES: hypothetical protein [unclassified Agrobacterium]|uniref:hypothetical protein n=1 Tax=Agrobacterium TaxID=357 RepID=UPI0003697863|nr:hypothetical protein L902_29810 [Agrobacterium radiobacter DSM 30147]
MSDAEKIIVVQFKQARGGIAPGDMRPATSAASAEKMASAMAPRHIGVAANGKPRPLRSAVSISEYSVAARAGRNRP